MWHHQVATEGVDGDQNGKHCGKRGYHEQR
jgi:hypothetical protein